MTSPLLEVLPLEVRDQIWKYVLSSPTGWVGLFTNRHPPPMCSEKAWVTVFRIVPYDPKLCRYVYELKVKRSILHTCKQIHAECKDLFWKCNGLHLDTMSEMKSYISKKYLASQLCRNLRCLQLDVQAFDPNEKWALKLAEWACKGSLKELSVAFTRPLCKDGGFQSLVSHQVNLKILRNAMDAHVRSGSPLWKMKMILNMGFPLTNVCEKARWLRHAEGHDQWRFLQQFNKVFRGEMWVDGILCVRGRDKIEDAFKLNTEEKDLFSQLLRKAEEEMAFTPFFRATNRSEMLTYFRF